MFPYHDDLIANGMWHRYFANCPRTHDWLPGLGCNVFQWRASYFSGVPPGVFNFEAILYDGGVSDLVFVYGPDFITAPSATIGMQNPPTADALNWVCNSNTAIVAPNRSLCTYDTTICP